jgi:hypothetical protein
MLARYKIYRGKPPVDAQLPVGIRQDTRKHTRHCLRPPEEIVAEYLANPTSRSWKKFASEYLRNLDIRYSTDATPFDSLANLATAENVYIGCSCPTAKNPEVNHCHTVLALKFMKEHYPALKVEFP